jgi:tetratricopeptide (TPR) repeat protein
VDVERALWLGEKPHALLRTLDDPDRFNRAEFRQAAFQEVARQYLDDTTSDDERQRIESAMRSTLARWLDEGRLLGGAAALPPAERRDALEMSRRLFGSQAAKAVSSDRARYGRVLALLAALDASEFLWERALGWSREFVDVSPLTGWPLEDVPFWEQVAVFHFLLEMGDSTRARRLAKGIHENALARLNARTDQESLRNFSVALEIVGKLCLPGGDLTAIRAVFQKSLEIRRKILAESLRDLSVALHYVGKSALAAGDLATARAAFQEMLEICRRILVEYGASSESLRDLSVALQYVGMSALVAGDLATAHAAFQEMLEICRKILDDYGVLPQSLQDVVISEFFVALVSTDAVEDHKHRERAAECLAEIDARGWRTATFAQRLASVQTLLQGLPPRDGGGSL